MSRIGLVLGGGGVVGIAWEIGVLQGLADATGFDPTTASVIVGTSAGSVVGSRLLLGESLEELAAEQEGPERIGTDRVAPDPAAMMEVFQLWTSEPQMTPELARKVGEKSCEAAKMDERDWRESFTEMIGIDWPDGDLRVTAVSVTTGERVVWTGASGVALSAAVASSCAVPGLFPPVTVTDDERFVDGGLWSGSNADLAAGAGVERALFIGPMGMGQGMLGKLSAGNIERERKELARAGIVLDVIQPGPEFAEQGLNLMDVSKRADALAIGRNDGSRAASDFALG